MSLPLLEPHLRCQSLLVIPCLRFFACVAYKLKGALPRLEKEQDDGLHYQIRWKPRGVIECCRHFE